MADAEEKAKAEKLAAAKKRVEALKKKKTQKTTSKKEEKSEPVAEASSKSEVPEAQPANEEIPGPEEDPSVPEGEDGTEETVSELKNTSRARQPSISVQSKMRSESFRQASGSGGPLSPDYGFSPEGGSAPDIYRKQASRIEELEKENKRLAKEASDGEKRWKKAEEELEDLREAEDGPKTTSSNTPDSSGEVEKLKTEKAALQRQLTQLQAQSSRTTRHGSSPSISTSPASLSAELASKSSTIESMEIEISNLRARLSADTNASPAQEQIAALEDKLLRTERAAATSLRELQDLKRNLDRTTEKAVKEGSERISAETKLRTLEREAAESKTRAEELQKKVDTLEKKITTLGTLHKEQDARSQTQKREREKAEKEASDLRARLAGIENENLRLREERERLRKRDAQGVDDEGVDELENEERQRLEKKVRELEGENHELRRGIWRERRQELGEEPSSFTDVDLGSSPSRRRSTHKPGGAGGIGDFFTSGFNAITGNVSANAGQGHAHTQSQESALLEDDDELMEFDEDAFRAAQEEEMKKRIERVKEVKRGLKNWEGWRLDLVESRRGGGEGVGEIFEI